MSHVLIKGIRSPLVPTLKSWLNVILKPSPRLDQNDNKFDEATFDAVVRFQTVEGLHPDGKVGSGTWGALGKEIGGWDFPLELIAILPDWLKKLVTGKPQVLRRHVHERVRRNETKPDRRIGTPAGLHRVGS